MKGIHPINPLVNSTLTDLYQLTMAYTYWKADKMNQPAVFDVFFRRNPFGGEFTVFAGIEEVVNFVASFGFSDSQIEYLKQGPLKGCDPKFFEWLRALDCSKIKIYSLQEGSLTFPPMPLIRIEGPLAVAQLLETTILCLINYPSLEATQAARFRLLAGFDKKLIEFGLRRAQGPDGGVSASRYSYIGGFNATSNVKAGELFGIPVVGTHAHSFVQSFQEIDDLKSKNLRDTEGQERDFVEAVLQIRNALGYTNTNEGELTAFISYAQGFPDRFLALVDTYDTRRSGVPNFICVASALKQFGYEPIGVRIDSEDLAYVSKETRKIFQDAARKQNLDFSGLTITASNDINETAMTEMQRQGHEINIFGIGTNQVTCEAQPALGCVCKLVMINGNPRIKLSKGKITIPGRKEGYRLIGADHTPILDVIIKVGNEAPQPGKKFFCRHPFEESKRAYVVPTEVRPLHRLYWDGWKPLKPVSIHDTRNYVLQQLKEFRPDHLRPVNPTPFKVSVSDELYNFIHGLWMQEAPIATLA
ncbi:MAG: nicotinate phosphoribosyltransferase [Syntrophobacterales bacterium]|jgi:nicotinate phosphoribosyltransferase|nr:nicotinate phosphoribosyltransferase [Syntrophobacterales bacterium]